MGKVDSALHPFCGSRNEYQACLGISQWGFAPEIDHLTGTSAPAPQSPRIKLFWIPLFGFNHFELPKTQQLVSEVGLNANNKSDGGPVPDSSRKIDRQHECQYGRNEIGVDRNEIGLDRQHECQHGRNEIGVDHQHECQ
ncbi:hypothetical protein TNCV_4514291 [Trichonephila clavipes]|nr:hypothetical protein TNCV_4514291 [Trichonephila clavipes]